MNTVLMDQSLKKHLLQTMVPVNALTEDHLNTLMRDTQVEVLCRGQTICTRGDCDDSHIYLLSGRVGLDSGNGAPLTIAANDLQARFPLAHYQPRMETITAIDDCQIIRFDSAQLDSMLAWDQAANYITLDISGQRDLDEDADWMLTLLHSNLFYKVPPMNIRQILSRFQPQFAHSGDVIIRQGEVGDSCYFVKEGAVSVYRAGDGKSKSVLVAELGVGRCFGEDALVNDAPRNATVAMRENGVLMKLDKQDFFLLLKAPPVLSLTLAEVDREMMNGAELIDVRSESEYELAHAAPSLNMPLTILKLKSRLLDRNTRYITYCNSGRRSSAAAYLLAEDGYNVTVLRNGFESLPLSQRLRLLAAGDESFLDRARELASIPGVLSKSR
ncbi:MAG TPA: cyclic nucleotide-binding domain-containing protein [Spongiibacteraceae bacterium]